MKLTDHAENIRLLIDNAFRNRLGRMGITASILQPFASIPYEYQTDRIRIEEIFKVLVAETGNTKDAYEKLVDELSFTLFNRIAALKVMEAHTLHPEIITRRSQHGDRSFAHRYWLEQNPEGRNFEQEGLLQFMEVQLASLSSDIPLFSLSHPYHLLPTTIELNNILNAFNQVDVDAQVETDIWKSDDVLGWLYESYNNSKKTAHKESKNKTEYNKVSLQSQVYTPRWVVKFLVDNSLGKFYLEMFPDSDIKNKYKIANAPKIRARDIKPITEVTLIDPATGSGNFLLYAFDLFYDLYLDQIKNYGASYDENKIPELIIKHNIHGVDLDDRAIQLAQFGLYIKAKRIKKSTKIGHFNIVSSDFFLPDYNEVKHLFYEDEKGINSDLEKVVVDIWADLQQAYKFGSLIRLDEEFNNRLRILTEAHEKELGLFSKLAIDDYEKFRQTFFANLQKAVMQNTVKQGVTFLNSKTQDTITFLKLLTQKYDIAVANPPYTDSGDFGHELKQFIDNNYKKPFKFNTNLYASFIKRCCELIVRNGKVALVHPPTFMYIKTFEDVRKYMIEKMHINLFVEWGYLGMFNPTARVDSAMYILEKENKEEQTNFIKLNDLYEGKRYKALFETYEDLLENRSNKNIYTLDQSKLKIIEGWPFIYWISDGFREKFEEKTLKEVCPPKSGLATSNNDRFLRFWWEVSISIKTVKNDLSKWVVYSKGGPYNKWQGNLWVVVNWRNNAEEMRSTGTAVFRNESYYFKEGITYSASGSKGTSFRYLPSDCIYDVGGASLFLEDNLISLCYVLALLNSKICSYIIKCLNPTVNTQVGDIERIPFLNPKLYIVKIISSLSSKNIELKKNICSFHIIETNFNKTPFEVFFDSTLKEKLLAYLNYENHELTQVLINEAIINELVFEVYELNTEDRFQVETKMGKPVGGFPVLEEAKVSFLSSTTIENETVKTFINDLKVTTFDESKIREVKDGFATLYQSNNDLEEFCIRHQINPINIWFWFSEAKVLPQARASEINLEFLADAIRTILSEDDDGIIPLVGLPEEPKLLDRLEQYCLNNGLTSAQFMQLDGILGTSLNDYLEHKFFNNLSNHLNLFMYLPKTPFIWHLSSGPNHGLEVYISIYKWSRDNLFRLKTAYINKRIENLEYRQIQLVNADSAQAQNEKNIISLQLQELSEYTKKIDELIAEGYDPKLDDGVGKNIAPLQKKGLLRCDVLNAKQLEKYLKADW